MSLVSDQVCRLDAYLDRLPVISEYNSEEEVSDFEDHGLATADAAIVPRLNGLMRVVQSLSTGTSSKAVLSPQRVKTLLLQSRIPISRDDENDNQQLRTQAKSPYENEVEWLIVSKATVQIYGGILNTLLDQIIPLNDGILYWDDVLNSYTYSSLYTIQTSPIRLWAWTQDIYQTSIERMRSLSALDGPGEIVETTSQSVSTRWHQFYNIVRESIRERSFSNIQRKVLSPVAFSRSEIRRKQAQLKRLRGMIASGLGVLMDEGLQFGHEESSGNHDLRGVVERSVALMDMVLREVSSSELSIPDFEDKVFAGVEEDPELSVHLDEGGMMSRPGVVARRLVQIVDKALPAHFQLMRGLATTNGRPGVVVRYWVPAVVGILSSTTVLRILVNRKDDILNWVQDFGTTVRDFWVNWVVEPTEKVIRTIRHDATSEIAIMSRDSLKADRESLQRMVVDFAKDKPHYAVETQFLSESQLVEIRNKVAEGDVTPVLRAFEKDLRSPFMGAIRGDLVRSLLIQVQKTKVDLEVAMTGIDSLLKSQELVFGFVGLTPGIFVSIGVFQYLRGIFSGQSRHRKSRTTQAILTLRNIDRVLTEARPTENNVLSYKDHGLLLCELHILRDLAHRLMPKAIEKQFLEDLDDLANIKGIQIQAKALERIRWAFAKWLQ